MLFGSRYVHPTPDDAAHQAAPVAYDARVRGPLRGLLPMQASVKL